MASIEGGGDGGSHKKGPGVKKAKKLSTRVDMTPMVDLGFLLITFFIFTATMSSPTTLGLNMPKETDKPEEENKTKQSGALTVIPGKKDQVYYYEGELTPENASSIFKSTDFKGIREAIIKKKKEVISHYALNPNTNCAKNAAKNNKDPKIECADEDFVVVIKPMEDASYKNTVDILDEMTINGVKRFALVKVADTEKELVKATEQSRGIQ